MIQTPVIDFHAHSGRWSSYGLSGGTPDAFVRVMDDAGVDKIAVNCIFYGNARRGNDVTESFVRAYPDRFIGVGFVTPRYPKEMIPNSNDASVHWTSSSSKSIPCTTTSLSITRTLLQSTSGATNVVSSS